MPEAAANTPSYTALTDWDPLQRCTFVNAQDPNDAMRALFNPSELPFSTKANFGDLAPIGWPFPHQQYASTGATGYQLTLPYSAVLAREMGFELEDHRKCMRFFQSFLYSDEPGLAPPYLVLVWPNTAVITNWLRGVDINIQRWDRQGNVMAYEIRLELTEVRDRFVSRSEMRKDAFMISTNMAASFDTVISGKSLAGAPLLVSGKAVS